MTQRVSRAPPDQFSIPSKTVTDEEKFAFTLYEKLKKYVTSIANIFHKESSEVQKFFDIGSNA